MQLVVIRPDFNVIYGKLIKTETTDLWVINGIFYSIVELSIDNEEKFNRSQW